MHVDALVVTAGVEEASCSGRCVGCGSSAVLRARDAGRAVRRASEMRLNDLLVETDEAETVLFAVVVGSVVALFVCSPDVLSALLYSLLPAVCLCADLGLRSLLRRLWWCVLG